MPKPEKQKPAPMDQEHLRNLIASAVRVDRKIALLEAELKTLKAALTKEARLRKAEQTKTDGGGWSWTAEGVGGCIVRVTKAGDTLRSSIEEDSDLVGEIRNLLGDEIEGFRLLFDTKTSIAPQKKIREAAVEFLGDDRAEKLLHLITTAGKTTVSFETKKPTEAVAS